MALYGIYIYIYISGLLLFTFHLQQHLFHKEDIPTTPEGKTELMKKLMPYNVSILEYSKALQQEEIR